MGTNTARRDASQERLYSSAMAGQARQRLEQERDTRLRLLATLDRTRHHQVDEPLIGQWHATRCGLEEIDAALRRLDDGTCPDCLLSIPAAARNPALRPPLRQLPAAEGMRPWPATLWARTLPSLTMTASPSLHTTASAKRLGKPPRINGGRVDSRRVAVDGRATR
jgi:hypothetical protein